MVRKLEDPTSAVLVYHDLCSLSTDTSNIVDEGLAIGLAIGLPVAGVVLAITVPIAIVVYCYLKKRKKNRVSPR